MSSRFQTNFGLWMLLSMIVVFDDTTGNDF
jgi:hypothetical protein